MKQTHNYSNPLVSVLLPVYNAEQYLRVALQSLLTQTYSHFEIIAVDDGSSDRSLQILQELASADDRIRIISRPNTGIVGALNDALQAARGQFIARMDADDRSLPTRLEKQVRFLQDNPEVVAVGCEAFLCDPKGTVFGTLTRQQTRPRIDDADVTMRVLDVGEFLLHSALMIPTEHFRAVGGYRKQYEWIEDADLYVRLAERGRLACLPEKLHVYRQHLGSVCRTRTGRQAELRRQLAVEVLTRRGKEVPKELLVPVTYDHNDEHERTYHIRRIEQYRRWSWIALNSGFRQMATRYALSALVRNPLYRPSLWSLLNALIGPEATAQLTATVGRVRRIAGRP